MTAPKKISLFFLDIDGTLTGKGGSLFHDENGLPSIKAAEFLIKLVSSSFKPVLVSSRNRIQVHELSRLFGGVDFIAEMGRAIFVSGKDKPIHIFKISKFENPYFMFKRGTLSQLLKDFEGYLEPHDPWWKNSKTTLLLRGCLKHGSRYLLEKVREELANREIHFLRLIENGKTRRKRNLLCSQVRIYHLSHIRISKLTGVQKYLETVQKNAEIEKIIAAGDSASDLELADVCDRFYFIGSKNDLEISLELLKYQNLQVFRRLSASKLVICPTRNDFFEQAAEEL